MAIIYSYERENNPQLSDLLLGTDVSASGKPTKLFSIQDIVNLVETGVPGGGTVTNIDTNATTYITMSGGPITQSGTLTASLSATGVPSPTTFLRGDNVWAVPATGLNTTYTMNAAQSGPNSNIRLNGSDSSQSIISLIAGPNIILTNNGSSNITIGVTGLPEGTVTSVIGGSGLYISSGSATLSPTLAVDLTGTNNYINSGKSFATAISDDFIAFNQSSSTNVKTTTLGNITPAALALVKSYIDAGDEGDVRNNTDTYTNVANVNQIVSLSDTEYAALASKNANTLYIVVAPAVEYTTTLAFTNNISGTEYTITGDQAGATRTGVAGASYAYNSNVVPNSGFYFSSGPSITNAVGLFNANETVYTILSGTVSEIVQPPVTATLSVSTAGVQGTQFTLSGDLSGATRSGQAPLSYSFNTTITPSPGYVFTSGPVIENASGEISGSQTVVTTISGVIEQAEQNIVTVTAQINQNFTGGAAAQAYVTVQPNSFSGNDAVYYNFDVNAFANSGYYFASGPTITGDITGTSAITRNAVINVSGQVEQIQTEAIVNLVVANTINGPTAGYTIYGSQTGDQEIGSTEPNGFAYSFNTFVELNEGYEWVSGQAPTIINAAGVKYSPGTYTETTSIYGATVVESAQETTATLDITYNITGPSGSWFPTGYLNGASKSGLPNSGYNFTDFTPSIAAESPYTIISGPSTTGTLVGTFDSTNKVIPVTVTATVGTIELCTSGTLTNDGGPGLDDSYSYNRCQTGELVQGTLPLGDSISLCIQPGSIQHGDGLTWVEEGNC